MSSAAHLTQAPGTILAPNVIALGTPSPGLPTGRSINWAAAPKRTGVTIERNIVHGSEAWVLTGKKDKSGPPSAGDGDEAALSGRAFAKSIPNPNDTHRWRVYLRALNPKDDLTHFIKEVTFQLHESFAPNKVSICAPPYEVEATGWGEFDIHICVTFHDTTETAVEFDHMLKLFAPDSALPKKGRSIISEHHDQIFFTDPSEPLYQALMANPPSAPPTTPLQDDGGFHDEDTLNKVISCSDRVKDEIARLRDLYDAQVREARELRKAIDQLQVEEQNRHLAATNKMS